MKHFPLWLLSAACFTGLTTFAQNVGIGETTPAHKLEVKGTTADSYASALLIKNSNNDTLFKIRNDGQVGIGTTPSLGPAYRLRMHSTDPGNFIHLSNQTSGNTESNGAILGIAYNNMYLHNLNNGNITLRTANIERMRIDANGKIGIGIDNPAFILDINGRTRIRHNAATAGIWFNNSDNTISPGFVGMFDDNTIGFYGSGLGWSLMTNTDNGNTALGGALPDDNIRLLTQSDNIALYTGGTSTTSTAIKLGTGKLVVEGSGVNTNTSVFVHKSTASNTPAGFGFTVINNPYCNSNPGAILITTMNATYGVGAGPGYNDLPEVVGDSHAQIMSTTSFMVFYNGPGGFFYASSPDYARDKWCIRTYSGQEVADPTNFNFNVMVVNPN